MLEHLGENDAAARLMNAVEHVCASGPKTRDIGGTSSTKGVGDAVVAALGDS